MEDEAKRVAGGVRPLQDRREELHAQARNLAEAIAAMGHSPTLLSQLSTVEREAERVEARLAQMNKPMDLAVTLEELREFVARKAADLGGILRADVATARRTLAKHIEKLVLTPRETPEGAVLEVSGDVDLFGGEPCVVQMVARDGIAQHYNVLTIPLTGIYLDPKLEIDRPAA
jgi:hypothetical protein